MVAAWIHKTTLLRIRRLALRWLAHTAVAATQEIARVATVNSAAVFIPVRARERASEECA